MEPTVDQSTSAPATEKPNEERSFFKDLDAKTTPDGKFMISFDPEGKHKAYHCTKCGAIFYGQGSPSDHKEGAACETSGRKFAILTFGPDDVEHLNTLHRMSDDLVFEQSRTFGVSLADLKACYPELVAPLTESFIKARRVMKEAIEADGTKGVYNEHVLAWDRNTFYENYITNDPTIVAAAVKNVIQRIEAQGCKVTMEEENGEKVWHVRAEAV